MGYGQKLNEHIENTPGMSVNKLSKITGISSSTLYSIIKRDSAVRYDYAVRIANVLGIEVSDICKENPYSDSTEVLPGYPTIFPNALASNRADRTLEYHLKPILMYLGVEQAANVEQILTTYAKLSDAGRSLFFEKLNQIEDLASDEERSKEIAEKIQSFKTTKNDQE